MSNTLKKCPFCGGEPDVIRYGTNRQSALVSCSNCSCTLESNEEGAGHWWNTRTELAELQAELNVANDLVAELQRDAVITMRERDELRKELSEARNEAQRLEDKLAGAIEDLNHANEYINTAAGIIKERNELRSSVLGLGKLGSEYEEDNKVNLKWWNAFVDKVQAQYDKETEP